MGPMPTLSLSMIVKNEAAHLPRCLASVRDLVDEIVVVDTGSTDETVHIAETFGARVGHFPWTGDFSAARNASLRLCTGDWILVLDADEAVDPLDHPTLRKACEQKRIPAFTLTFRNYFLDGDRLMMDQAVQPNDGRYPLGAGYSLFATHRGLRLCRNAPGLAFTGRIHELLDPYFHRRKLPIGSLDAVIHHFGKVDLAREEAKKTLYLQMALDAAGAEPRNQQHQFNVLLQAAVARDWELAIRAGTAWLALSPAPKTSGLMTLAVAYQGAGRVEESIPLFQRILALEPDHPTALCRLALSLAALQRTSEALEMLEGTLRRRPDLSAIWLAIVDILSAMRRYDDTREVLKRAVAACPKDPALRTKQVDLDLQLGLKAQAVADAWEALRAIPACGGGQWHSLVASHLLASGHAPEARVVVDLGLKAFPGNPELEALRHSMATPI
ncbi:hypothetical protein GETHPA_13320 [Geothrix rubra]|uniref:Glycosyltransferase 2-like domain-containing protein n=1 Tax=Geothrix rubra TaxID=2927977 RepID=A0ABQ5Q5L3_9BACT|nr:TPR domain-containing glycosyltransferase [Geothrix rubra]GLH69799.1 hypothetical protein GETHPA_13320 [Geothrix rubra]